MARKAARKTPSKPAAPVRRSSSMAAGKAAGKAAKPVTPASKAAGKPASKSRLKPLAQLSPAYQKRIRAYAKTHGLTVKQARAKPGVARGHQPGEHRRRAEKRDARIDAFAERQAYRGEVQGSRSGEEIAEELREKIAQPGYGMKWFNDLVRMVDGLSVRWVDNGMEPIGIDMTTLEAVWELPTVELFYH
jgi:hypothetical protein